MFRFGWYFNAYPLNFSIFSNLFYLLLLYPLPAILLYSLHFLFPFFLSLSLSFSPWARAMKCSKQKCFCILRFCLSAREWLLQPGPATASLCCSLPHRSGSITGIWVNALYALRCRSKGPQRAGLRPQNWRKQATAASNVAAWLWLMNVQVNCRGPVAQLTCSPLPSLLPR